MDVGIIESVITDAAANCAEDPSDFHHEAAEYQEAADFWRGLKQA